MDKREIKKYKKYSIRPGKSILTGQWWRNIAIRSARANRWIIDISKPSAVPL